MVSRSPHRQNKCLCVGLHFRGHKKTNTLIRIRSLIVFFLIWFMPLWHFRKGQKLKNSIWLNWKTIFQIIGGSCRITNIPLTSALISKTTMSISATFNLKFIDIFKISNDMSTRIVLIFKIYYYAFERSLTCIGQCNFHVVDIDVFIRFITLCQLY